MIAMSTIDTKSIVSQLMAVERRPQDQLRGRVSQLQKAQSAWQQIGDKLSALKTAAEALAPTGTAQKLVSVTSDDTSAVGVRATGAVPNSTSVAIEVDQLASAHSVVMTDTFTGTTASDGGRSLDLTVGGTNHSFTSDDGTIGGLAREINAAGIGINARVLQTSSGTYQLALTSSTTGAASVFTADTTGWAGATVARAGSNASFTVDGVTLTRSSNTVSDVIDGVELTLKARTTGQVNVTASRDDDAIVAKVKALVDAANSVLTTVGASTATSGTAASRGVLSTDSTAKQVGDLVRNFVSNGLTGANGTKVTAANLGVSMSRDGKINFDESALRTALASDADAVFSVLGRGGSSTLSGVSVTNVASTAVEGPRTVSVTRAAAQASMVGVPVPAPPDNSTVSLTVMTPNGSYSFSFTAGSSYAETAANLTAAMRAAGLKMTAGVTQSVGVDDGISITNDAYGSGKGFTVTNNGTAASVTSDDGVDAQATIDGTTYTAVGRNLLRDGVAMSLDYTEAQLASLGGSASGTVRVTSGFAGGLSEIGGESSSTGITSRAKTSLTDRISDLESRISKWDDVLSMRQSNLEKRFNAMDQMLTKLNAISAQLGFSTSSAS
jgi:flagellar hook-associated protein 2